MTGKQQDRLVVMGGGSWGGALADQLARAGQPVTVLVRAPETAAALQAGRLPRLGNAPLSGGLEASTDPACLAEAAAIFLVLPVSAHAEALGLIKSQARHNPPLILTAKGLVEDAERGGLFLPEWVAARAADLPLAMLTGPSFADEVVVGKPAALMLAAAETALAARLAGLFEGSNLRLYHSQDLIGAALGGAVKNVMAIAAGITIGLGFGDNARAGLMTRALAETARLAAAVGAERQTIYGLSGLGDLILSSAGPHSRNMAYGLALGRGEAVPAALAEGRFAAARLVGRATFEGVEMPIAAAVDRLVNQQADLMQCVAELLARQTGAE
ncbi:MAG: NAD(P)H-dependent glycerol-3-phosphate dehydrogenase [Alphaproteobacteria bacterium]|jgi:glycerol-3-phosphate dehydrogenase (NAD(P)+)|nr:NAD(P)H-dependent glycerol-3-phosphate dehydrogenase [Alphaproteobacteria bacterium]